MKTYPLTQSQLGIFMEWASNPSSTQYNLPIHVELDSNIDVDRFEQALLTVAQARPMMRTRFVMANGTPRQYSDDNMNFKVKRTHMTDSEVEEYKNNGFCTPFDLLSGEQLWRFEIVETPSGHIHFFWDCHHSVSDGTTIVKFKSDDLPKAYVGAPLDKPDYSEYEFAEEEVLSFGTDAYNRSKQYYAEKFADANLLTFAPQNVSPWGRLIRRSAFLPCKEVDDWSKEHGVASNNLYMAAVGYVLSCYSHERKIAISTVNHGRINKKVAHVYGMFVRSAPILFDIDPQIKVIDYVSSTRRELMSTIRYGNYPFNHFCSDLQQKMGISFAFQGASMQEELVIGDNEYRMNQLSRGNISNDIVICIYQIPSGEYETRVECSDALYDSEYIGQLAKCVNTVVRQMMAAPEASLGTVSVVDEEETQQLIKLSSGEKLEYDKSITWINKFLQQAAQQPNADAVIDYRSKLTYEQLNSQSAALASKLIDNGVVPGDFVAISLPRVKEFFVAVLAAQRAGAAYVPIDMKYPDERKLYMKEDSEAKLVIDEDFINGCDLTAKCDLSLNKASADGIAYMIYTSGSTGKPKGVPVSHKAIMACAAWRFRDHDIKPGDNNLHHPSFSFDASTLELFYPLAAGATVHIVSDELQKDMDGLARYINDHHIVGTVMSTAIGMALLNQYDLNLGRIELGGEKYLPVKKSKSKIINGYGPTEFTVCSSYHVVDQDKDVDVPIGRPVPNSYSFICDKQGNLLPQGIPGELCLAGDQIAEGYWNRPELTEKAFAPCPFMPIRMYRTGDLALYNADGELEFLGRIDNQVKLRGFRIEMGEIENRANSFDGIEAVAAEVKTVHGNQHLVLYYVAKCEINEADLRQFLAEELTDYMVPTAYVQLDVMPMTPNGKVNRKALPDPVIEAGEIILPETDAEKNVFELVKQILNIDEFGVTNNLVSLGLSSLAAMRLTAIIQKEMNVSIKMGDVMKAPTVRGIVDLISAAATSDETSLKAMPAVDFYPITESQRGIYVDWEMNRDSTQYNVPQVIRLKDADVDIQRMANAVKSVIEAHPYLKSHLVQKDNDVVLQRRDDAPYEVVVTTLTEEPSIDYFQQKVRPFNLLADDLIRAEIVKTPHNVYLITDVHHIVYDGMSGNVFFNDIFNAYNGTEPSTEPITAFDYAIYEDNLLKGTAYDQAQAFFDGMVSDASAISYPDSTTPDGVKSASVDVCLPQSGVDAFCSTHGVTASSYLQAAFALVLHRITREQRPLFLTVSAGRSADVRLMRSVGMFVKTLPVAFNLNDEMPVSDFVKAMHQMLLESYANDFYPYTHLVERHGLHAEMMFSYQGGVLEQSLSDSIEFLPLHLDVTKFPIDITTFPDGTDYHITIDYNGNRYSKADMLALANAISTAAIYMATAQKASDVPLLSPDNERLIAKASQGQTMPVNSNATFPALFIRQATLTPNNAAVTDTDGTYSYAELNLLTASLAEHIATLGINADKSPFIAIMLGYQKEFLVAAIGIERAGYAYVPLDYDYPNDRLLYMLEDSDSSVMITSHAIFDEKNSNGEFNGYGGKVLFVDDFIAGCDKPKDLLFDQTSPDKLAYMIYTSGSTGKPKGVMIPQSAKANFVQFIAREWRHTEKSRILCHSSFSFDASIEDLYPVLTVGGTLFTVPQEARKDMALLHSFIISNGITGGCYTTQLGQMLLQLYPDLPVDYLVVGGEKMTVAPECRCRLINTYGPTEFTVDATYYELTPGREYHNIPIGRPLHNLAAYVADQSGHLLPEGMAGELCMAGPQMAAGYWHRPELTAEKFTEICIAGQQVKVYRTGDLVKYNAEGEIEYLGRIDNQVKLRGFRIEMGEIESRAAQFSGIKMAVAEVKTLNNNESLVLYYSADRKIEEDEIKAFLSESLTDYMVPTVYVQLDEMPLTPNGKVNRKALPQPTITATATQSAFVEPESEMEKAIAEAFAKVLGQEKISANDDFFTLGGTSISAIKVLAALSMNGYQASYKDLFAYQTPRLLAAYLQGKIDGGSCNEPIQPQTVADGGAETRKKSDYAEILEANTLDALRNGQRQPIGDVLLTGATGFMGIHMLRELLENESGKVYCLLRTSAKMAVESRLRTLLFYYFDNTYEDLFNKRIFIIEGDVTDKSIFGKLDVKVDTVINCAANVKHFSAGDDIEKVNVESVRNLIDWCVAHNTRLIQVSTVSVAGQSVDGVPSPDIVLDEHMLDFGQSLANQYVHSKYEAEKLVLEAIKNRALRAKIMRVATLASRNSDGLFQINFRTNGFMGQLKTFAIMGCVPYEMLDSPCEFSPIDEVCLAARLLATTPDNMVVFHACNNHTQPLGDVLKAMESIGIHIEPVEYDEFERRIREVMIDDSKSQVLQPLLAYVENSGHVVKYIRQDSSYTTQVLYRLGYWWPQTASDYVKRFIKSIGDLGYFNDL